MDDETKERLWQSAINADEIPEDDEIMLDTEWDKIYDSEWDKNLKEV